MIGKALGLAAGVALILLTLPGSGADHFWSGSLTWTPVDDAPAGAPAALVSGFLSFDTRTIPSSQLNRAVVPCGVPTDPYTCDFQGLCDAPLVGLRLYDQYSNWNPTGAAVAGRWGRIMVGENPVNIQREGYDIPFALEIVATDPAHCRFAAKIIDPLTGGPVKVPNPSGGAQFDIIWSLLYRNAAAYGHVNNGNQNWAGMVLNVDTASSNLPPVIDFAGFAPSPTPLSEASYGNVHCPQDSMCKFRINAGDADGDKLRFRLGTSDEATAGYGPFTQPGAPWTGPFTIDPDSGIVTWDTRGANVGEIFSAHIIVTDGYARVPIDFMIEVTYPPPPCPGGPTPTVDPDTGAIICPPTCPPGAMFRDPADPFSGCVWPPVPVFDPVLENPMPPQPWYMPLPPAPAYKPPAVSEVHYGAARAGDRVDGDIAGLDQDDDGVPDRDDLCPFDGRSAYEDADSDGIGDACDADADGDGVDDAYDSCPDEDCPEPEAPLAKLLGSQDVGVFAAGVQEERGEAGPVNVAFVAPESEAGAQSFVLGMVGAAMAVLLLGMAMRRRG